MKALKDGEFGKQEKILNVGMNVILYVVCFLFCLPLLILMFAAVKFLFIDNNFDFATIYENYKEYVVNHLFFIIIPIISFIEGIALGIYMWGTKLDLFEINIDKKIQETDDKGEISYYVFDGDEKIKVDSKELYDKLILGKIATVYLLKGEILYLYEDVKIDFSDDDNDKKQYKYKYKK